MSFSGEIKEELSRQSENNQHCRIAELAAILSGCGQILIDEEDFLSLDVHTENLCLARKYYVLLRDSFGIQAAVTVHRNAYLQKSKVYHLVVGEHEDALRVLKAAQIVGSEGEIREKIEYSQRTLLTRECCRRAYLRGAFMASGSISDPEKSYHLEIVCQQEERAAVLKEIMNSLGFAANIIQRKNNYVVYLKEGEQIADFLACMGAHRHLFELENVRILKEVRNNINRKVNCETANLNKTVSAAVRQIDDIRYIMDTKGIECLPGNLRAIARLRLEYPESSLKELGEMLDPPVGKSGVNHRLRRISEIADKLRG